MPHLDPNAIEIARSLLSLLKDSKCHIVHEWEEKEYSGGGDYGYSTRRIILIGDWEVTFFGDADYVGLEIEAKNIISGEKWERVTCGDENYPSLGPGDLLSRTCMEKINEILDRLITE